MEVGRTKCGKGTKLEVVTDARGLPLGAALADVPLDIPPGTPVIADRGHDSDPLRDAVEAAGLVPVIPHRSNRVRPSRNDGRRLRRYRRRWTVERTNAWLHCYRALAVRWAHNLFMYEGLVYLAFIRLALQRF